MSLSAIFARGKMTLFAASIVLTLSFLVFARSAPVQAQGAAPLLDQPLSGCYDVEVYGVGMFGTGQATVDIPTPPGPIAAVYIEWVGAEDTTPGGLTVDGVSELAINGVTVTGVLAEPFTLDGNGQPIGNAGYDPRAFSSAGPNGWFAWHANIGPDGPYGIVPATPPASAFTLDISGWTSPSNQTNGATITVIYSTGDCEVENEIRFLAGVNWYHQHTGFHEFSELLIYPVEPADHPRAARMYFSHAGTDKFQQVCRGGAVWMAADNGSMPMPTDPTAFDIVAIGDNDNDGVERGYGINGGVEILNDPFTSAALPCTPDTKPVPDEPYAPGHPYPNGIADAPFRIINIEPSTGGDVGEPGEWGVIEATILLPANARWVAFQLESEPDQDGESGSWVGGGVFLIEPDAVLGDRAWEDVNGNGRQDAGEPGVDSVDVTLRDNSGTAITTTVTTVTGLYEFTGLAGGDYSLRFDAPDGFVPTAPNRETGPNGDAVDSDIDPATGETGVIDLARREVDLTWDAGFYRPVTVGDFVWLDANGNGLQDAGERGVPGVVVTLSGAGPDDVFGTADDVSRSTTTAQATAPGSYLFANLPPGRYFVTVAPPGGYGFTATQASDDARNSDVDPDSGATRIVTLRSGESNLNLDAGLIVLDGNLEVEKLPASQQVRYGESVEFTISVYNPGPVDLFNVQVLDELAPACSADIGDLAVGERVTYSCIQAALRTDIVNVVLVTAVDILDRPVATNGRAAVDVLPAISLEKEANPVVVPEAGGLVTFTVSVRNIVEEPLTLTSLVDDIHGDLDGQGNCALPQTLTTGAIYTCSFPIFVVPGPNGERDTITGVAIDDEGNEAQDLDDAIVMPRPLESTNSGLGDYVWYDSNGDGLQSIGEQGVPNVRVLLYTRDGALVGETATDSAGKYGFSNLAAGEYYLLFRLADASPFTAFSPHHQGDTRLDSNVNPSTASGQPLTGRTDIFSLPADFIDNTLDAGLTVPTAIEGTEPTAVDLVRFLARPSVDHVALLWETSAEMDTNGFHIYRSTNISRTMAVRITEQMVPAHGPSGGVYQFVDGGPVSGVTYHYWLVEVENGVEAAEFGPVRSRLVAANQPDFTIYLPTIVTRR